MHTLALHLCLGGREDSVFEGKGRLVIWFVCLINTQVTEQLALSCNYNWVHDGYFGTYYYEALT